MANSRKTKFIIIVTLLVLALLVVSGGIFFLLYSRQAPSGEEVAQTSNDNGPSFTFDAQKIKGWQDGGNQRLRLEDFTSGQVTADDVEKVSATLSQSSPHESSTCMVTWYYWEKPLNESTAQQTFEQFTLANDKSLSLNKMHTTRINITTAEGTREFPLHLYDLVGEGSSKIMKGIEFGVLPIGRGYIEVRGYCNTYEQLLTTMPVVSSANFKL